ncbi:hypothetical protein AU509_05410 [Lonsdalea britannica]|nr:hypothetical protein AU509_05410 [Lonsdalea britannica]
MQDYRGASVDIELDQSLTQDLKSLSQHHGATLFMLLLAGWSALMSRLSGQEDVVIGSPVAGRDRQELEPLIGMFVNTLALRVDLSEQPDTVALLAQVKATTLAAQGIRIFHSNRWWRCSRPPAVWPTARYFRSCWRCRIRRTLRLRCRD